MYFGNAYFLKMLLVESSIHYKIQPLKFNKCKFCKSCKNEETRVLYYLVEV